MRFLDTQLIRTLAILHNYQQRLIQSAEQDLIETATPGARAIPEPPKSLRKLTEELSIQQQARLWEIRERILSFDAGLIEMGKNDIYKTKMCVQFTPILPGVYCLRLLLGV